MASYGRKRGWGGWGVGEHGKKKETATVAWTSIYKRAACRVPTQLTPGPCGDPGGEIGTVELCPPPKACHGHP